MSGSRARDLRRRFDKVVDRATGKPIPEHRWRAFKRAFSRREPMIYWSPERSNYYIGVEVP